jgi:hypothetical protein
MSDKLSTAGSCGKSRDVCTEILNLIALLHALASAFSLLYYCCFLLYRKLHSEEQVLLFLHLLIFSISGFLDPCRLCDLQNALPWQGHVVFSASAVVRFEVFTAVTMKNVVFWKTEDRDVGG